MSLEKLTHATPSSPSFQADRPLLNEGTPEGVNGIVRKDDGFNYLTGLPFLLQKQAFQFEPGEVSAKLPDQAKHTAKDIQRIASRALHLPKSPATPRA
jgi:hypothetical protein